MSSETQYFFAYGSLMREFPAMSDLGIAHCLEFLCEGRISGELYDLGEYPGLVEGGGIVFGEVFRVLDGSAFEVLDLFEDFDENDIKNSLYLRKRVKLIMPELNVWTYFYNRSIQGLRKVGSGAWTGKK